KRYRRTDLMARVDVEVRIVKDTSNAQAQFESGQLDVLDQHDPKDIKRIQSDPNLKDQLHNTGFARTVWIGLNVKKGPFSPLNDAKAKALREAVAMGIDRQQIIDLALQGTGQPVTTLMAKGVPGYHDFTAYPFDAAGA